MSYNYQYAVTLTGPEQEAHAETIKAMIGSKIQYLLMANDISANDNVHIHLHIRWLTRLSPEAARAALEPVKQSVQYCEPVKHTSGYTKYITDKKAQGMTVKAYGDIPMSLQCTTGDNGERTINGKEQSCEYKLTNGVYATRDEAIEDFKLRASNAWTYKNAAVMAAINREFPIGKRSVIYKLSDFTHPPLDFSNEKTKVLVGPSGKGKTAFACAHFDNPLIVTQKQDWAKYKPEIYDGAVVDDMPFTKIHPVEMNHILEMREATTIRVLYGVVELPAKFRRIFTTNKESLFWPEQPEIETIKAWKNRSEVVTIKDRLFRLKRGRPTTDTVGKAKKKHDQTDKPDRQLHIDYD